MLDEFRSTNITWDKATSRIYSPVTANESDENGRKLVVQIVNSGQVEDLTGATLHLYWETRDKAHDGLDVFEAVDLKNGEFELSYTTGMLSNQGVLNANLVLIDTVGRVVSERFKITVTEGIDDDAIQSENSFSSLTQALIDISNLEQNYAPRLNDLTAQLQQTEQSLNAQLAHIDLNKANIADLPSSAYTFKGVTTFAALPTNGNTLGDVRWATDTALNYAWTGTAWTPIGNGAFANGSVVNSKLATGAVNRRTLDATLGAEVDELFPPDPNPNVMATLNSDPTTVTYFYDGGDALNATYTEPIVNGIKEYHLDTTAAYTQLKKPYVATDNKFDVAANTDYVFTADVDQATASAVGTLMITDGTNTLSTQYFGFAAGATSLSKAFTTPTGATKVQITLFSFNENITGEHHLAISNLALKTTLPQDHDIVTRTETLEATVTGIDGRVSNLENVSTKSYFILDFDYGPTSWSDLNITTVLDEYGYPFKFNFSPSADPDISWALVRRGCEMSTYYNEAAFLPTDAQMNSTDPTDIAKVDAYVKQALTVQYGLNYRDQLTWSTRQFTTGVALENALKKYGYAIQRLRAGLTLLPTSVRRNKLTKFFVSDNTTNWYQHTLDGIDLAIANGGSLAIFTHKIVPTDDSSGINIIESQYRLILNKIKGFVDAGQAEVITYRDYFEMFKEA